MLCVHDEMPLQMAAPLAIKWKAQQESLEVNEIVNK
jgi:ACT domain-containing protein